MATQDQLVAAAEAARLMVYLGQEDTTPDECEAALVAQFQLTPDEAKAALRSAVHERQGIDISDTHDEIMEDHA